MSWLVSRHDLQYAVRPSLAAVRRRATGRGTARAVVRSVELTRVFSLASSSRLLPADHDLDSLLDLVLREDLADGRRRANSVVSGHQNQPPDSKIVPLHLRRRRGTRYVN